MINSEEIYYSLGKQCAMARNQQDEARAQFHKNHYTRAKALECQEDKEKAEFEFSRGYEEYRNKPRFEPFK